MATGLLRRLFAPRVEDPILAEIRAGGASFGSVVFTRNRRVMVSIGEGGKTLRLNERFRNAPADVLRALGQLLSGRPERTTRQRDYIRDFLRENPPESPAARRRRHDARDMTDIDRLRGEFDRVNVEYFTGSLPAVPIGLSGRMRRRNGIFSTHPPEIVISRSLCRNAAPGEAEKTLRHEMIHLWQHVHGHALGHGRDFRRWARELDIHPRATREVSWSCDVQL